MNRFYRARHRSHRFTRIVYVISKPLTRRGQMVIGGVSGFIVGAIVFLCFMYLYQ